MPFKVSLHAHLAKSCDELAPDEIVTFGDGRLALAFSSQRMSYCWSHLIDLGSFEVLPVDDLKRLPAAVVSLGTDWILGFESISACTKASSFAPGNLLIDDRGTWLVVDGLQRFGLAGSCIGDEGPLPNMADHRAFRVAAWKLSQDRPSSDEPLSLKFSDGKRNAGWFSRKSPQK